MARSIKKGRLSTDIVLKKVNEAAMTKSRKVIKTWSRRSTVTPDFVGLTFAVHNGRKFIPIYVTENMVATSSASLLQRDCSRGIRAPGRTRSPRRLRLQRHNLWQRLVQNFDICGRA
jgi:small subunit ribosomal protein S19